MDRTTPIKPMGILLTTVYWAIPAAILYIAHYVLVPRHIEQSGQPYLVGYLAAYVSTMALFLGTSITDSLGIALVFLLGWLFNIIGEELWFRGYILPRQEHAMGRHAWIANGLMFTLNHIWQPWNLLMILPGALLSAWVVQRSANTWILILVHGLANAILLVVIVLNGFGVKV